MISERRFQVNNEKKAPVRQIKFRGLRVDGKGWAYGDYFNTSKSSICKFLPTIIENGGMNPIDFHLVQPQSIGQLSDSVDKNDKQIWEGDVVKFNNRVYTVIYRDSCFFIISEALEHWIYTLYSCDSIEIEVIGNIHEESEVTNG